MYDPRWGLWPASTHHRLDKERTGWKAEPLFFKVRLLVLNSMALAWAAPSFSPYPLLLLGLTRGRRRRLRGNVQREPPRNGLMTVFGIVAVRHHPGRVALVRPDV